MGCLTTFPFEGSGRGERPSPWRDQTDPQELLPDEEVLSPLYEDPPALPDVDLSRCIGVRNYAICPDGEHYTVAIAACVAMLDGIHEEDHESHILQSLLVESIGAKGVGKVKARRAIAQAGGLDLLVKLLLKWQQRNVDTGGSDEAALLLETKCCWALASLCPSCETQFASAAGGRGFEGLVSALRTAHHENTTDSVSQALVMQVMRILKDFVKAPDVDSDDDEETQEECRMMATAVIGFRQTLRDLGADAALKLVLERFKSDGMVQWRGGELMALIRKEEE